MISHFLKTPEYVSLPQHTTISPAPPWFGKIESFGCGPVSLPWSASISPALSWLCKIEWSLPWSCIHATAFTASRARCAEPRQSKPHSMITARHPEARQPEPRHIRTAWSQPGIQSPGKPSRTAWSQPGIPSPSKPSPGIAARQDHSPASRVPAQLHGMIRARHPEPRHSRTASQPGNPSPGTAARNDHSPASWAPASRAARHHSQTTEPRRSRDPANEERPNNRTLLCTVKTVKRNSRPTKCLPGWDKCRMLTVRRPTRTANRVGPPYCVRLKRLNAILVWPTPPIVCFDLVVGCTKVSHHSWKGVNPWWELGQLFGPLFRALRAPPAEGACLAAGWTGARPMGSIFPRKIKLKG